MNMIVTSISDSLFTFFLCLLSKIVILSNDIYFNVRINVLLVKTVRVS